MLNLKRRIYDYRNQHNHRPGNRHQEKAGRQLFDRIQEKIGITHQDIEICIYESPACNWGFRGMHSDEVTLNHKINV